MNRFCLGFVALVFAASSSNAAPVFSDPVNDVFDPSTATSGAGTPDIVSYSADYLGGPTVFTVTFAGPITAPSVPGPNSILGYIDLDTDRNAATGSTPVFGGNQPGGNSFINFAVANGFLAGPPISLGDELFIDIGSEVFHPGFVELFNALTNLPVANLPISFTGNSFTISVPSSLLGTNGSVNDGIYIGNVDTFAGDRAPNGALAAVTTPEPASAAILGLLCVVAGRYARRRNLVPV